MPEPVLHVVVHRGIVGLARNDLGVRVDRVEHFAVLRRDGQEFAPDGEEVCLVAEVERDVFAAVPHQVVRLRFTPSAD